MAEKYTVKAGDTLSGIGAKYGLSYADSIKKISGYKSGNPNLIYGGETLSIDTTAPTNSPPKFNDTSQAQNYLNTRQNNFYNSDAENAFDMPQLEKLDLSIEGAMKKAKNLLPTVEAPTAPNLLQTFTDLRSSYGLDTLEAELTDLKAQEDATVAQFRVNVAGERSQPVAEGVIEGRVGEQERTYRENLDFVQRQISRKTDQLKTAYGVIDTIMNLTQKDFDNARATYNDKLDEAYKAITIAQGIQKTNMDIYEQQQATARANAQIYVNLLKDGNISLNQLSPDQKVTLNKMELQAGLPMGFFSSIKKDPKADIISTTSNNGQIQVLMRGADGGLTLQSYGTPSAGKASFEQGSENYRTATSEMNTMLTNVTGGDGYVSPEAFRTAAKNWVGAGFQSEDFFSQFRTYVNPAHYTDYGIPDKYISQGY